MFEALDISRTSMTTHQTWLDAISDNIANINTIRSMDQEAFQARYVIAQAIENGSTGAGVAVAGIDLSALRAGSSTRPTTPWPTSRAWSACPTSTWANR